MLKWDCLLGGVVLYLDEVGALSMAAAASAVS